MSAELEGSAHGWTNVRRTTASVAAALASLLALAASAGAATYSPNAFSDSGTTTPGDCNAPVADGACSLREAIRLANDTPADDEIVLSAGTYVLESDKGTLEIDPADFGGKLLVRGAGARTSVIDGNSNDEGGVRPLTFRGGANGELRDLAVTGGNGDSCGDSCEGVGGGIRVSDLFDGPRKDAVALLTRVRVFANAARDGGGIFNQGKLTLVQSLVDGNAASEFGGGIDNGDELTLTNSTVSGNEVDAKETQGDGGGVRNSGFYAESGGPTQLFTKTEVPEEAPFLRADNSTIASNKASGNGGGVATRLSQGCVTAWRSLSGCQTGEPEAYAHFHNTIVSDNTANGDTNCSGNQPQGSGAGSSSEGHNLEDGDSCLFTASGDLDKASKLAVLADNGGGTDTHALAVDSPAVNAAESDGCPPVDQRGTARPQDGACDIGAFERVPDPAPQQEQPQPPPQQPLPPQETPKAKEPSCLDTLPPVTQLHRDGLRVTRTGVTLGGTSRDQAPPCVSGVERVEVSMAKVSGTDLNCRFLRRSTTFLLSPFMNCRQPIRFVADGTSQWSFRFKVKLAPGKYRAQARAYDQERNKETPKKHRNIVTFTVK